MLHATVCSLLLLVSSGCMSNLCMKRERTGQPEASSSTMEPLIRGARGTGLVVGIRVPFDLSRSHSSEAPSEAPSTAARLLSIVSGGRTPVQVSTPRPAQGPGSGSLAGLRASL